MPLSALEPQQAHRRRSSTRSCVLQSTNLEALRNPTRDYREICRDNDSDRWTLKGTERLGKRLFTSLIILSDQLSCIGGDTQRSRGAGCRALQGKLGQDGGSALKIRNTAMASELLLQGTARVEHCQREQQPTA